MWNTESIVMKFILHFIVISTAICAAAVPRYSAPIQQVGDHSAKSAVTESSSGGAPAPSAPMLQRIKQEAQSCSTVVVKLMQRPLGLDVFGGVRKATGGTAAHVQVVAMDKTTGRVIDNFGVTGDFSGGGKARIFRESSLDKYDDKPCGEYEMSSEDYYAARARTIKQIEEGAIYEPYSGVGLKDLAKVGAEAGAHAVAPLGSIAPAAGAVAGAVGGAMAANDIYETRRHDYGIHSDSNEKMSFPIINCQAGGDLFVKNLDGLSTVITRKPYAQPGEMEKNSRPDETRFSIDTSKLEALLGERITMLEDFISHVEKNERLNKQDKSLYEENARGTLQEIQHIDEQIKALNVPAGERKQLEEQTIAKIKPLLDKVSELESRLTGLTKKSDDATCHCSNPRPYACNGKSSIPGWANCENCGRLVGTTLNGKIISNNPLTNGKEPRWVTFEEAVRIQERMKKK